ncbi:MAG: porin family protein [Cellvibrionales bacterium]|nr:porin family protein [Cellvibrionales bacterium]
MFTKLIQSLVALALTALVFSPVYAEDELYYGGLGYAALESSAGSVDRDAHGIYGSLGVKFNKHFSGEVRAAFGVGDDQGVELDTFFGAYVRAGVPITERFSLYALAGYTRSESGAVDLDAFTVTVEGVDVDSVEVEGVDSASETDISFGVGTDYKFTDRFGLNVEYTNYLDKGSAELSGFSVGGFFTF